MADVPKPSHGDNEVLVKVCAASLNDWDWGLLHADFINRILNGFVKPKIQILGSDISGRVEAVGKNVTKFKPGDEVFGDLSGRWGGFAEYACAPEHMLELKSSSMSFEQAASIPQAAMLAVQGLIDKGKIQPGQKILINGAGGGVGTFGIQIAKQFDVEITAVDSAAKLPMLQRLGAAYLIDYRRQDFTLTGKRYDLILDVKTNRPMSHYLRALTANGKYVTVGGDLGRLFSTFAFGRVRTLFTQKNLIIVALKANKDLRYINSMFEGGKLVPVIDGPYTLDEVPAAFRIFGRAEHQGKMVIKVAH
jgi:NADPH:quinone reductase-like Zn-dependent oxidoreductase